MTTARESRSGGDAQPKPVALPVPAADLLHEIQALGITHVLNVPDTHQKTLLAALAGAESPRLLTVCTEDEAIAINAGLYIGGQRPMLSIQNTGFFASLNALRGIALDAKVPTFLLVGLFGRQVTRTPAENRGRAVRLVQPTLETWGVPCYTLEGPDDLPKLAEAYRHCQEIKGPVAVLVGAPTA